MFKRVYRYLYVKTSRFFLSGKVSVFSDTIILAASGYLLLKKGFGLSISGWLLKNALHQPAVDLYLFTTATTLISAIIFKISSLIFVHFPAVKHATVEPEEIAECLQVMNKEISSHIARCDSGDSPNLRRLSDQHSFDVNIRLVTDALAEHIRRSIQTIRIKRKDLFLSLYTFQEDEQRLTYELHCDPRRDLVHSKEIDLTDAGVSEYECVKCMNSPASTAYVLDKQKYARGNVKRHKTVEQYMGCKLGTNNRVYGFLNIEFHNNRIFVGEEEMQDFMEENIFPFKLLLEYQYLKRDFFARFEEYEKHWRVA